MGKKWTPCSCRPMASSSSRSRSLTGSTRPFVHSRRSKTPFCRGKQAPCRMACRRDSRAVIFGSMSNYCLETAGLCHRFSAGVSVLNKIDLRVPEGSIYGFLGPNGAGKTTTLRLVLGLLKKQQGEISVFGKPFAPHRISILKKLGSMIESPSVYAQLTAAENLRVLQKIYRCPEERIPYVLQLTGLGDTGGKKAGQFS